MTELPPVTGEASGSKVAAIFDSGSRAREVAAQARDALALSDAQVQVVMPGDHRAGRKLEPESHGIFRTMIRAHGWLGLAGIMAGAGLFYVLWLVGTPMVANSPIMAVVAFTLIGGMVGLMLGGLVTLRPDHDPYILKVFDAIGEGRSAVVVHAMSREQYEDAEKLLTSAGGDVVASLAPTPGE